MMKENTNKAQETTNTNTTEGRKEKAMFEVIKMNSKTNECKAYGAGYTAEEVKQIVSGYKFDCELNPAVNDGKTGKVYTRKSCSWFFIAYEMKEEQPQPESIPEEQPTTAAAAEAAEPAAETAAAEQQPQPETIVKTETGKKASPEDIRAENLQTLEKLQNLRMNPADNAERTHELKKAVQDLDREIMAALGDHMRKEGKKELKAAKAAKKAQRAATLEGIKDDKSREAIEEMESTREVLLAELADLTRKESNREEFETGADWLAANAALKTVEKGIDREELTRRVFAPILAMLYRTTCRHQYREDWDVYEITANGKMMPTQRYNDYKMQIYTELYSLCIDRPNDSFKDLLFLATKKGIYAVWSADGNHRRTTIDPETGKRVWAKVTEDDIAKFIEYAAGDGSEGQHDDGENATDSIMIDSYQNTAARAINNAIADEILRDRTETQKKLLTCIAYGMTGEQTADVTGLKSRQSVEVTKSRLIKRIRAEYPEYIMKEPEKKPKTRERVLPYIKYKFYLPPIVKRITAGEYAGTVIKYYKSGSLNTYRAGDRQSSSRKAYTYTAPAAETAAAAALADFTAMQEEQQRQRNEAAAKAIRKSILRHRRKAGKTEPEAIEKAPEARKDSNNAGMLKSSIADLKRKQYRRERAEREAERATQRRHELLTKAEQEQETKTA